MKNIQYATAQDMDSIVDSIRKVDMVLVGEIHGVSENVKFIENLLKKTILKKKEQKIILAFEWGLSAEEINQLNQYIHRKTNSFHISDFMLNSDARCTGEHIAMFEEIRKMTYCTRISIACFDSNSSEDEVERSMSDTLIRIHSTHPESHIIVETGVMHARKTRYKSIDGKSCVPMGLYLNDSCSILSIFIRYSSGTVIVDGVQYKIRDAYSQIVGPGDAFDIEYTIPVAHPARLLM